MALRTARTITPTSANTASQRVAKPQVAKSNTPTFTPMENTTFWRAMPRVRLAILMAVAIFEGKGRFLEKNDGDRGVFPVFGKTLFCVETV